MERISLPLLPLRDQDVVVFPTMFCKIDVGRSFSLDAVAAARANNNKIIIGMQKSESIEVPQPGDFHSICTEAEIKMITPSRGEDGSHIMRIVVVGLRRGRLEVVGEAGGDDDKYIFGEVDIIKEPEFNIDDHVMDLVEKLIDMISENISSVILKSINPMTPDALSAFVDDIASQLPIVIKQKLEILGIDDPRKRLSRLIEIVGCLTKQSIIDVKDQPEYNSEELNKLHKKVNACNMSEEAKSIAMNELRKLDAMTPFNSEFHVSYNYVDTIASLPWGIVTEDNLDIDNAKKQLDSNHYGLEKVKDRILEFLAVKKLAPRKAGMILCFIGPPGVGKTSLGRSIASTIGKKFARISLGGMHDEAEIRGHRRTYMGAMPGKIIQEIKNVGSTNPVFMLDEVDKLSKDFRGDPASALLEVLDPEQNVSFTDNYLGTPFDLSNIMFIMTANEIDPIPSALCDRMEVIEIPGYSPFDKVHIAQKYLVPKQRDKNGLEKYGVSISSKAIGRIIEEYTSEAGVRDLERQCDMIMRKIAVSITSGRKFCKNILPNMINRYLGPPKVFTEKAVEHPEIGLSAGLAWSRHGGSILFVETLLTPGKGEITLTGNLGDVLKESICTARTWIKSNAEEFGVNIEKLSKNDIHVHLPAGATPKDGPSAGIAIVASMLSLLLNKPVRNDIAMTGEITLRGRILPIGGLKGKILAAHRAGIKEVLYPVENEADVEEVPSDVKKELKLTPVSNLKDAVNMLLLEASDDFTNNITITGEKILINRGA
jgi:ATP-dependent Lon protease